MFRNRFLLKFPQLFSKPRCLLRQGGDLNKSNPFTNKMNKILESSNQQNKFSFQRLVIPGAFILGSFLIYEGWKFLPYGQMFEHFTISEYVNQKNHYHAIFLAPLSFQTTGHFLIYFPIMAFGLILNSRCLSPRNSMLFYGLNCLLSTAVVYWYEKYYKENKMIVPKCLGACTALSNAFFFLGFKPQYLIFGSRFLPYFLIPAIIGMYEINEFNAGYVNEISRPAHLSSMVFGLIFGIVSKRIFI